MKLNWKLLSMVALLSAGQVVGFGACASSPSQGTEQKSDRPNIILIMSDDMGYECLSCNGSVSYKTPRLDGLAQNGVRFTNCYSQPLCTPSRVKLMTGRYNCNNYVDFAYLDVKEKTFGNLLQDAGYKTMVAGKWQLNGVATKEAGYQDLNRPYDFGFDEYSLWWMTEKGSRFANPKIVRDGKQLETTIDDYGPDIVSDHILDFIDRNQNESFFVYYPMMLVHAPFVPTPDSPEWADPSRRFEKDNKYFKDMVAYNDKIVGKIVDKLNQTGLAENTIFIFIGDNGTNKDIVTETTAGAYPGGKGYLKDNGTHVPMIVSWPAGGQKNMVMDDLVEFSDFLPTLAQAANVKLPANIDGKSFLNALNNQVYEPRENIFVHYYPNPQKASSRAGCFVRTKQYKLYSDGRFYDMIADKWEKNPLEVKSLNPAQTEVYLQLKVELKSKPVWDFSVPHRVL